MLTRYYFLYNSKTQNPPTGPTEVETLNEAEYQEHLKWVKKVHQVKEIKLTGRQRK